MGGSLVASQYIGFSVTNDIRGFATPAAPSVSVGEAPAVEYGSRLVTLPNPASRSASIRFSGPGAASAGANASVALYDVAGRLVRELALPGGRETSWDLTDAVGAPVSPGTYFLRSESRNGIVTGRLQIVR
jgi:hypothetical protein